MILIAEVQPTQYSKIVGHISDIGLATILRSLAHSSKKQKIANVGTSGGTTADILGVDEIENITAPKPSQREQF